MARTPLLRALRQLAGEHDAAEQLGVSVEEVRARHAEQAYSRKDFLKRAGAAGAVLAAAGPAGALVRTARGATAPRIAIVGGGIAGLTTALTLQDRGIGSTVYEAHPSRIGGRMHSDFVDFPGYWANGQGAELCGELIDTGHKTILALARRFNLATVDLLGAEPNGSTDTYRFFGDYYPRRRGRSRLQGDPRGAAPRPVRGELSDDLQDLDARGDRARQHEHLRVDRVPRARAATRRRSASCSTSPTTSSTAPRRPSSPRSTSSTCSATPAPPSRSTASPTSASTSSAATPCSRSRSATRSCSRRALRRCAWAGG